MEALSSVLAGAGVMFLWFVVGLVAIAAFVGAVVVAAGRARVVIRRAGRTDG